MSSKAKFGRRDIKKAKKCHSLGSKFRINWENTNSENRFTANIWCDLVADYILVTYVIEELSKFKILSVNFNSDKWVPINQSAHTTI